MQKHDPAAEGAELIFEDGERLLRRCARPVPRVDIRGGYSHPLARPASQEGTACS